MTKSRPHHLLFSAITLGCACVLAQAQPPVVAAPPWRIEQSLQGSFTLPADFKDVGGELGIREVLLKTDLTRRLPDAQQLTFIINGGYLKFQAEESGDFIPGLTGELDPVLETRMGLIYRTFFPDGWSAFALGAVEFAGEADVNVTDAASGLMTLGAAYRLSPSLTLGASLFATYQFEDNRELFPAPYLDWRINHSTRLRTERQGVVLSHFLPGERTELTATATFRSLRFRLDDDRTLPGGIIEYDRVPVGVGMSHRISESVVVEAACNAIVYQEIKLDDQRGRTVERSELDPSLEITGRVSWLF